jgi:hypothetical protein
VNHYSFYLEYDGRRTLAGTYEDPTDVVHVEGVLSAINTFTSTHKLKKALNESLSNGDYRAYFVKKPFLGAAREFIYYIKVNQNS